MKSNKGVTAVLRVAVISAVFTLIISSFSFAYANPENTAFISPDHITVIAEAETDETNGDDSNKKRKETNMQRFIDGATIDPNAHNATTDKIMKSGNEMVSNIVNVGIQVLLWATVLNGMLDLIYIKIPPIRGALDGGASANAAAGTANPDGTSYGGTGGAYGGTYGGRRTAQAQGHGSRRWVSFAAIKALKREEEVGASSAMSIYLKESIHGAVLLLVIIMLLISGALFALGSNLGQVAVDFIYSFIGN
ncbi:hypothetical protein FACS1894188_01560 [Clostridia bacterium]|nr:hypothetical protein FACS1894188_01560 [Clostridia bacterium]